LVHSRMYSQLLFTPTAVKHRTGTITDNYSAVVRLDAAPRRFWELKSFSVLQETIRREYDQLVV